MLVLTRRVDEGIRVDDDIRVVVIEIRDNQVKLGIEAPRGRSIHREEIYLRIEEENRSASMVDAVAITSRLKEIGKNEGKR